MRTFGTFWAVGIAVLAVGCGSSSSSKNSNGRDNVTGSCANATCAAANAFTQCIETNCSTQIVAALGSGYASGSFSGPCAQYQNCKLACPCDATATTCEGTCALQYLTAGSACSTAYNAVQTCGETVALGACASSVATCPTSTATGTGTGTTTTTTSGTNCVALQTCCTKMTDATIKAACQGSITNAGGVDSTCALILQGIQSYCP